MRGRDPEGSGRRRDGGLGLRRAGNGRRGGLGVFRPVVVVESSGLRQIHELLGALDAAVAHERVVRLAVVLEPAVGGRVAPFAAAPQLFREPRAATDVVAAAVIIVAIEVAVGKARELLGTRRVEEALAGAGDLQIEGVLAADVEADVGHLHEVRPPHNLRMRAAAPRVPVFGPLQFEALAAVVVALQSAFVARDGGGGETHRDAFSECERLLIGTRRAVAAHAHALLERVQQRGARGHVAVPRELGDAAFVVVRAARLAAIPVARRVSPVRPHLRVHLLRQ
mmetsp:Transcript_29836/g.91358  ORF Transcript_29836/g.91358 Transcript_29836/m.91358 type:complete len:282 (-) Transcript_29836:263-1108(-)